MKIAVIGGGSSYTPELIDGLFPRLERIPVSEVVMMDPNAERLSITASLAQRMAERHGNPFEIRQTNDLRVAVEDAKYVITQLRVGGIQARIQDEKLGRRYDIIGQETTGVGGFACALRTIPVVLEIARAMEETSPDGFLVNFTNPSGIVTEALIKHSKIRSVGLCNVPIGIIMEVVKFLGCKMEDVELDYIGLNHLSWVRKVLVGGEDVTKRALDAFLEHAGDEWEDEAVRAEMVEAMGSLGMICNGYLQYFYGPESAKRRLNGQEKTRGETIVGLEESLFKKYQDPNLSEKPEELSKRGGAHYSTAAFYLIEAIENDAKNRQVVACRNDGAVPTFDDDAALELTAEIGADGPRALPQLAPDPAIRGLMQQVKAYETLTVEAAVTGDRERAFQALLANPTTPGAVTSRKLLEELLEINKRHVNPAFFGGGMRSKSKRQTSQAV